MRPRFSLALALITAAVVLGGSTQTAYASDERHRPKVGSTSDFRDAIAPESIAQTVGSAPRKADPVSNGVGIGVAIGAATGLGFMAWAYAQCNDTCDAPEPLPMYLQAGGFGAAIGGVVGWIVDAHRKNTNRRVAIGGAIAPKHSHLQVRVRW
jgi:hypothetical protein